MHFLRVRALAERGQGWCTQKCSGDTRWRGHRVGGTLNTQNWSFLGGLGITGPGVPEVTGVAKVFRETREEVPVPNCE